MDYCLILKKEQLQVLRELSHRVQSGMSREGKAKIKTKQLFN